MYTLALTIHVMFVVLSAQTLIVRLYLRISGSKLVHHPMMFASSIFVLVMLVLSIFGLSLSLDQFPFSDEWMTEKFVGLCMYLVFAILALLPSVDRRLCVLLGSTSLGCLFYAYAISLHQTETAI